MMNNGLLGICIPVYNEYDFLVYNLKKLNETVLKNQIEYLPVYISDNCSDDDLKTKAGELTYYYPNIIYSRNETNVGADKNFDIVLHMCTQRYAWLLSSNDYISGNIKSILDDLESIQPDFMCVYCDDSKEEMVVYTDSNDIFLNCNHSANWMSADIFSTELIKQLNFDKYYHTYWAHEAALMEYASCHEMKYCLNNNKCVFQQEGNKIYWEDKIVEVYMVQWPKMILSLPNYSMELKERVLREIGLERNIDLLNLRSKDLYNYTIFKKNYKYLKYLNRSPKIILAGISVFPKWPILFAKKLYLKCRK